MSAGYRDLQVRAEGGVLRVGFILENRGHERWTFAQKLALGWQLYDPDSSAFLSEGEWLPLESEMAPGDTQSVSALPVELPREAGRYRVYLSVLNETDGWFYQQHWPFVVIEAQVDNRGEASVNSAAVTTLAGLHRRQRPRQLRLALFQPWQTIWTHRRLISSMVRREITARYRGSFGDAAWTILHPLLLMLTYYFVFGIVLRSRFGGDSSQSGYVLNFLAGMLPWLPFSEAAGRAPTSMLEHRNFIKKLLFPVETIQVIQAAAGLVTQAFALLVFLALLVVTRGLPPLTLLWLPILLIPQMLLTLGVSWTLSALGVYLRDLGQMIGFLLTIGFFLTPICYPSESLPAWALPALKLNPMFTLVESYRAVLVQGMPPRFLPLTLLWAVSLTIFLAGHAWFWRLRKTFADVI